MKTLFRSFLLLFIFAASCTIPIDVFEKNVPIPHQQWSSSFKPDIIFNITDTVSLYNIYVVFRHSDAYNYNNLWIRATVTQPGAAPKSDRYDITLATNEKGWLGSSMDDIYEHRALLQPQTRFTQKGEYHFLIEQVMREDPLLHSLNIGIRIEKAK